MSSALNTHIENFIFVASTGRSGTETLTRILQSGEMVRAVHEPEPVMYNDYPDGLQDKRAYFRDLFYQKKLPAIEQSIVGYRHYAETNHQFIKTFADFAIEVFRDKIRIIHLSRDPVRVAMSFYRIGSIPGRTKRGRLYLLDPEASDNLLDIRQILQLPEYQHDMYRCLWYCYETEARIKRFRRIYDGVPFYRITTDQLNSYADVQALFLALDITYTEDKLRQIVGTRANLKSEDKKFEIERRDTTEMNDRLLNYLDTQYGSDYRQY